jgi:hypothetical protein
VVDVARKGHHHGLAAAAAAARGRLGLAAAAFAPALGLAAAFLAAFAAALLAGMFVPIAVDGRSWFCRVLRKLNLQSEVSENLGRHEGGHA